MSVSVGVYGPIYVLIIQHATRDVGAYANLVRTWNKHLGTYVL